MHRKHKNTFCHNGHRNYFQSATFRSWVIFCCRQALWDTPHHCWPHQKQVLSQFNLDEFTLSFLSISRVDLSVLVADSCNDCPRCGEPDDCSGRPLPAEVEVYPDLYPPESKPLNYPLVVCNSPVQADIATGLPLTLQDATEDWRQCRVCMYKIPVKNSIIKGFMRPPHQDYHHYKYYGFGGKGAKTSWAHNPKFKM